jgi:hypothetical protein
LPFVHCATHSTACFNFISIENHAEEFLFSHWLPYFMVLLGQYYTTYTTRQLARAGKKWQCALVITALENKLAINFSRICLLELR